MKHVFACYHEELPLSLKPGDKFSCKDATLWNRLVKILRIKSQAQPAESFILFNEHIHVTLQATDELIKDKRFVTGIVQSLAPNTAPAIPITLYLPLLKKEAFEHAIYISAELGVSTIIPIITEKCHPSSHESQRLYKIMIAACEQAKNFWIPKLHEPCNFAKISFPQDALKICFDDEGKPSSTLQFTAKEICVALGPEGGFTEHEKNILEQSGFQFYRLTKTILRSQEAVCVGLGVIQSTLP